MAKPLYTVTYRGGFADRNGIIPENTTMQIDSLDDRTRMAIRNFLMELIYSYIGSTPFSDSSMKFWRKVLRDVYSQPADYKNYHFDHMFSILESTVYHDNYANVLSLLEFIIPCCSHQNTYTQRQIAIEINNLFEREYVGYRYVNGMFVPITSTVEFSALEESLKNPYKKVVTHIENALRLLSDRNQPDYPNSIKESISAVEAMCSIILGKASTLGEALKAIESQGVIIHPALKGAFDKLYGYTSDAAGIRHAGQLGGADATFDEAKYMAVSCSAFVNYLLGVFSASS